MHSPSSLAYGGSTPRQPYFAGRISRISRMDAANASR